MRSIHPAPSPSPVGTWAGSSQAAQEDGNAPTKSDSRNRIRIQGGADMSDRRRQPEQTRARLVEAAACSFAEHGYAVTTVQQICQLAGVSVGAFYYHFQDKPGITVGVLERE